jgi:multiple sugar transport system ATP-binding protein
VLAEHIVKLFGNVAAINDVTVEFKDGDLTVLVGPSGCGKTTLLRTVAGLEDPTSGNIYIGDRRVNDVPPWRRDTAMVFQNYALYPHMTVFDNMAYPLRSRGEPKRDIKPRVEQTAAMLGLGELLRRKPRELSGGQMQRVAVGRAIVRRPGVFLMDEPLSNLDAKLRVEMRAELKRLQEDLGVTTIYVTHDQAEAMTMADTLIVMRHGIILQSGVPQALYDTPLCIFVAGFIGSPPMNFLPCTYDGSANGLLGDSFTFPVPPRLRPVLEGVQQSQVVLGIRPEDIIVNVTPGPGAIVARVYMSEPLGRENLLTLQIGGAMLRALAPPEIQVGLDQTVGLTFPENRVHLFDKASERSLTIHA